MMNSKTQWRNVTYKGFIDITCHLFEKSNFPIRIHETRIPGDEYLKYAGSADPKVRVHTTCNYSGFPLLQWSKMLTSRFRRGFKTEREYSKILRRIYPNDRGATSAYN